MTQKLAVITTTGSTQVDHIFQGLYGSLGEDGKFKMDEQLSQIYLLGLADGAPSQAGVPGKRTLIEFEMEDEAANIFKANLLLANAQRWSGLYKEVLKNNAGNRMMHTMLMHDREKTMEVVNKIQEQSAPLQNVAVHVRFQDARVPWEYENDEETGDVVTRSGVLQAQHVLDSEWEVLSARIEPAPQAAAVTPVKPPEPYCNYGLGEAVLNVAMHVRNAEEAMSVLACMKALPNAVVQGLVQTQAELMQVDERVSWSFWPLDEADADAADVVVPVAPTPGN